MADDNRNHGHRPAGHDRPRSAAGQPAGDPLAELARLIGSQNEAAPSYRQNGAWPPASHDTRPAADAYAADAYYAPVPGAHDEYAQAPNDYRYPDQGYAEPGYDPAYADPRYPQSQHYEPHYADPHYADPRYGDAQGYAQGYAEHAGAAAAHGDPRAHAASYDRHAYAPAQGAYGSQDFDAPPFARGQGYDDSYHAQAAPRLAADEHAPARKRGGIVTALAVLALAVVGTAAAFGYRAMFGTSGTAMPPPVIKADTRPTKVVPPTEASAKPIQDRVGVKTERVVSREEQPVELRDPARNGPRVVFPNLAGQNQAPTQTIANIAPAGAAPSTAPEPKKVRTVAIRPDQPAETASARPPAPSRAAAEPEESPRATPRSQGAAPGSAPLPLAPAQPQRQAARPANPGSPFPTPIGSSGAAASGAYAVQVTSQRTEADAQAAFRSLQSQFPSVLGSRQAVIRRADLGEKGTYYRAQVGPFASQSEASEFCGSLKAAGGQCVVQRN